LNLNLIKAVIFDLDETLIDVKKSLSDAHNTVSRELKKFLKEEGIDLAINKIKSEISITDDSMNTLLKYDRNDWWQLVVDQLGIAKYLTLKFKKKLTEIYWDSYTNSVRPYKNTIPVLNYLKYKNYALGLITDTDGTPGQKKSRIDKLTFCNIFDSIIIAGEDTIHTKPNPESYIKMARSLHCFPFECVYVGDKPYTDIKGALAAGMKNILIQRRKWNIDVCIKPDFIIKNLKQLKTLL
jgi:putative hydrolase of the HAD superfamily